MSVVRVPVGATTSTGSPKLVNGVDSSKLLIAPTQTTPSTPSISSLPSSRSSLPAAKRTSAPRPPRPLVATLVIASASAAGAGIGSTNPQLLETTAASTSKANSNASTFDEMGM